MMFKARDKEQDRITAYHLNMTYPDFVARRKLLLQQAGRSQRGGVKVFRFIRPVLNRLISGARR